MLDPRRLALLAEVIDRGSLSAAAAALDYTPSAVSQQIKRLELESGMPLLVRHTRGVTPTEAGELLAAHARRTQRRQRAAEAELDQIRGLRRGTLAVGTYPTAAGSLLPPAIRLFRERHPDVRLSVHSAQFARLSVMLEEGRFGLSLLWDYEWRRVDESLFTLTHLLDDPTVLIVSSAHRLARRDETDMRELADEEWIVRGYDHPVGEVLDRSCRAAGFTPHIAFEANDYQEAQAMVGVGLGVALVPRTALTVMHPDVRVLSLGHSAPTRRVLAARRRHGLAAPGDTAMLEVLRDVAGRLGPEYSSAP
ncbi:LysR family transcriptional regulator [Pseudonocardia sp. ICBG1122]|nr:LysR family transcriptional regulator [Pseudonocardia pini]